MNNGYNKAIPVPEQAEPKQVYETYTLKGQNLTWPDQRTPEGEAAKAQNCRMLDDNTDEKRVAISTRKGPAFYSIPIGETQGVSKTSTTGQSYQYISSTDWVADKFTASSTGRLTKVDVLLKRNNGSGVVMVKVYSDEAGLPGALLATSSFNTATLGDSFEYLSARFIEAPVITNGATYWIAVYQQDNALNLFHVATNTNTTTGITSNTSGMSWSALNKSLNFKTYVSTAGKPKGAFRRYAQTVSNVTLFAHGDNMYTIDDTDGSTDTIKTGMSSAATKYRFAHSEDKTYWVNGEDDVVYVWDGTTVTTFPSPVNNPHLIILHENRMWLVGRDDETRLVFSDLGNYESYASTSFFYIPSPKSGDPITALIRYQDYLTIYTRRTNHKLHGHSPAEFSLRQTQASKGTWSQETITSDRNLIYFVSDDGIYSSNGMSDTLLSDKVKQEIDSMQHQESNTSIVIWRNQLRTYFTASPSAVNNRCLIFDFVYKQWFVDTDAYVSLALVYAQEDNKIYEFSNLVGAAYEGEVAGSILGKPIDFKYWTPYRRFMSGAQLHRIKKMVPIMRATGLPYVLSVGRDKDFAGKPSYKYYTISGTGATWGGGETWGGGATWGSARLSDQAKSFSGRSKYSQFRFERSGVDTHVDMYGYIIIYKSGRIRA